MNFVPDIVVVDGNTSETLLVAEVKTSLRDVADSERAMRSYLRAAACPVGMLVTPERIRIYRNRYLRDPERSVEKVADFDAGAAFRAGPPDAERSESAFVSFVRGWLEGLTADDGMSALPREVQSALLVYVVPALAQGSFRGRFRLSA